MSARHRFVVGGYSRAVEAATPAIHAQVTAEWADVFAEAGLFRRLWLRVLIRREIRRCVAQIAPPDALY